MAAIPEKQSGTVAAIYAWREGQQDAGWRAHLGASLIGRPCARELWYVFRWATRAHHSGRLLRLFERGQREEEVFLAELRGIGCEVHAGDNGEQFRVEFCGGHIGGSLDGAAVGIPEAPKTWHVVEFKTHGAKSFAKLTKEGVEKTKPEHWAQMQIYMLGTGMTRALYLAANKDTDELYAERVRIDANAGRQLIERAEAVVIAQTPPLRLSDDASWWQCRFCGQRSVCHEGAIPAVNCRTCAHSTPELDGGARWSCAAWQNDIAPATQRVGCPRHVYLPCLLPFEQVDATDSGVIYAGTDGTTWEQGPGGLTSVDLERMHHPQAAAEPLLHAALAEFPGAEVAA